MEAILDPGERANGEDGGGNLVCECDSGDVSIGDLVLGISPTGSMGEIIEDRRKAEDTT